MIRKKFYALTFSTAMTLALLGCAQPGGAASGTAGTDLPSDGGQTAQTQNEKLQVISGDWTHDVTLDQPSDGTAQLSELAGEALTIPSGEAQAIQVFLDLKTKIAEDIDYYEGGVAAEYVTASLSGQEAAAYPEITRIVDEYNQFAQERAGRELEEGRLRHAVYEASEEEQEYIFLTSWIGLQVARSDSQVFSALTEVYRYNREYEPDYYELHGVTIDTQTGRKLTLADFFTDTTVLPDRIMESLKERRSVYDSEEERKAYYDMIRNSVEECRDDGSFAWLVYPDGIEFRMVLRSMNKDGREYHTDLDVLVPFEACRDILRENTTDVSYDYLYPCVMKFVEPVFGTPLPADEEGSRYGLYFVVQKNGQKLLYKCHDERTDVYVNQGGQAVQTGSCLGEIVLPELTAAGTMPDPAHFQVHCIVQLLQELFLRAEASVGEDGLPVINGLFEVEANPIPMTTQKEFEAEIFADEEAQESAPGTVPAYTDLSVIRSDGETFVDAAMSELDSDAERPRVCRLYVDGNEEEGWTINGLSKEEIIGHEGWYEE